MLKITKADWRRKHPDSRSDGPDGPKVVHLDHETGATVLSPVEIVDDLLMPGECGHPFLRTEHNAAFDGEGAPGHPPFYAWCRTCGVAGNGAWTADEARRLFLETFPPKEA